MSAALILAAALLAQDPSDPAFVDNCDPCKVSLTAGGPVIEAHFLLVKSPEGRAVRRIGLVRDGKQIQELTVPDMSPIGEGEQFMFGGVDINFDGNRDLMLVLERGVANSTAQYWLYDPALQTFKDVGVHPVFTPDPARKRLKTYERGGSAGLIFSAREFEFQASKLTLMREETQRPTRNPNLFQHTIRERRKGAMVTVKQETIPAPKK